MDVYKEIENHIREINRLVNENESCFKSQEKFSLLISFMFKREGDDQYASIGTSYGMPFDLSANLYAYLIREPDLIPILSEAVNITKSILSDRPDIADAMRNGKDIEA